jgi:hypothetical protein
VPDIYYGRLALPQAAECCTGAPALADIIRAHAARAAWMAGWVFGEQDVLPSGDTFTAHGDGPGHDHSGGICGTPIRRPLWSASFGMADAALTAAGINNCRGPAGTLTPSAVSGDKAFVYGPGVLAVEGIPGCPKDSDAHRKGTISICVYASHAATLKVQVQSSAVYSKVLNAAAFNDLDLDSDVDLVPGEYNEIPFTAWIEGPTSGGATWVVTLCSVTINQTRNTP